MLLIYHLLAVVMAQTETLQNMPHQRQVCAGIYSAQDRPGDFDSHVEVDFPDANAHGNVTLAIFAYEDFDSLGVPVTQENGMPARQYLCNQEALDQQLCAPDEFGKIIINKYNEPKEEIYSDLIELPHTDPIKYEVKSTGYYCIVTFPIGDTPKYKASAHFMNAYGHVPGEQYPLIWFHAAMFAVYVVFFALWLASYIYYRHDALAVQKWITGLAAYMVIEQVVLWIYYNYFNYHGQESGVTKFLLALVAILGAGRLSLTLFLVLIVALGYSVVHERLGPVMKWCKLMGVALFITTAIYSLDSYYLVPGEEGKVVEFLIFLPSAILVGIFYVFTLQSLGQTKMSLMARKQYVKARMYRNLWWVLLGSAIAILAFFVIHTVVTSTQRIKDLINNYWKTKWLLNNGWPNIVYMVAFILIALIWRPTGDNRRFAMSTQLAQSEDDAEEFEIGSLDGSDDEQEPAVPSATEPSSGLHRDPNHSSNTQTMFDTDRDTLAGRDHSDDEGSDHWNRNEDEDELVTAPGGQIKTSR